MFGGLAKERKPHVDADDPVSFPNNTGTDAETCDATLATLALVRSSLTDIHCRITIAIHIDMSETNDADQKQLHLCVYVYECI